MSRKPWKSVFLVECFLVECLEKRGALRMHVRMHRSNVTSPSSSLLLSIQALDRLLSLELSGAVVYAPYGKGPASEKRVHSFGCLKQGERAPIPGTNFVPDVGQDQKYDFVSRFRVL